MKKTAISILFLGALLVSRSVRADSLIDLRGRSEAAAAVLIDLNRNSNTAVPERLLSQATCIATFPKVARFGLIFGAKLGKGFVSCRSGDSWSAPAVIQLVGGSWAMQPGVQAVDVVLIFVRANAIAKLSLSPLTVGKDVTIRAGPMGRDVLVGGGISLLGDVYSYIRSAGVSLGFSVEGSSLQWNGDDDATLYGARLSPNTILRARYSGVPAEVGSYIEALLMY